MLLQPLGHLSVFRINDLRAACSRLSHTPATSPELARITFAFSEFDAHEPRRARKLCQTSQCAAITYGDLVELRLLSGESGIRG